MYVVCYTLWIFSHYWQCVNEVRLFAEWIKLDFRYAKFHACSHGLRTPREEIAFNARPKIQSQSQIFRYSGSIFCLPHRPEFSGFFDFCLHWVSVVRDYNHCQIWKPFWLRKGPSIFVLCCLNICTIMHKGCLDLAEFVLQKIYQKIIEVF